MSAQSEGARDGVDDVYEGGEGQLFLIGGHHDVRELFTGDRTPTMASISAFRENAAGRMVFCHRAGLRYASIVFPEKLAALRALVPFPVRSLVRDVYLPGSGADAHAWPLYPLDRLRKPRFWLRTDTHLSQAGALQVLESLLADSAGEAWTAFRQHVQENLHTDTFTGDLGRKLTPPAREKLKSYTSPETLQIESNGTNGANDGVMFIAVNEASTFNRRLLIFGDSFFRLILPELSYFFREIVLCRSRFFHYELVDAVQPDTVYFGCAERYLSDCVPDADRPHFFTIPFVKGKASRPTAGFAGAFSRVFRREALL